MPPLSKKLRHGKLITLLPILLTTLTAPIATAYLPAPGNFTVSITKPSSPNQHWYLFKWNDNSSNESGFVIEARLGTTGPFTKIYSTPPNATEAPLTLIPFPTGQKLQFRVRAFELTNGKRVLGMASNLYTIKVPSDSFNPPTNLTATALDEGNILLSWVDNSTLEEGFAVEIKSPSESNFRYLGQTQFNTTQIIISGFSEANELQQFRIRAVRGGVPPVGVPNPAIATAYSNTANTTTKNIFFHTELDWFNLEQQVFWLGNLSREISWQQPYSITINTTDSGNRTALSVSGLPPGISFDPNTLEISGEPTFAGNFTIRLDASFTSNQTISANMTLRVTPPTITSRAHHPATVGSPFDYQITTTNPDFLDSLEIVGQLPPGISFDSANGTLSGTPTTPGIYPFKIKALFDGFPTPAELPFTARVRPPNDLPPTEHSPATHETIPLGGPTLTDLTTQFHDPDSPLAVRLDTTLGNLDLILYPDSTPQTVSAFLRYVDSGDYDGAVFHRSIPNFVIQGGGFYPIQSPNRFFTVAPRPSPINEPGISNLRGTIAMAKIEGQPNSATTNFFFNLADNSANLDNQNSGFTVFGRLSQSSLATMDALAAKPTKTYAVIIGNSNTPQNFDDWPLNVPDENSLPATMDLSKVLKIHSIHRTPALTFTIPNPPNPSIASANIQGTTLAISGSNPGNTSFTLNASDLDGNSITVNRTLSVSPSVAHFLAGSFATLSISLSSTPGASFQWLKDGKPLKGATSGQLFFTNIQIRDAGTYELTATTSNSTQTSGPIAVAVLEASSSTLVIPPGTKKTTLSANFAGPNTTIRWLKNGSPIPGANSPSLEIPNFSSQDEGIYTCELITPGISRGVSISRMVVEAGTVPPPRAIFTPPLTIGQPTSYQLSWDNLPGAKPSKVSVTGLPPGLSYSPSTGMIFGTPRRTGTFSIKIRGFNPKGPGQLLTIPLSVGPLPPGSHGTFITLIPRDPSNNQLGGTLSLRVSPLGTFSGILQLAGKKSRFRGKTTIPASGGAPLISVTIPIPNNEPLTLNASLTSFTISGTLQNSSTNLPILGWVSIPAPPPLLEHPIHSHLFLIPPDIGSPSLPEGDSFLTLRFSKNGRASIVGRLCDNSRLTTTTRLLAGNRLIANVQTQNSNSLLANATLSIPPSPALPTLSGFINWLRQNPSTTFQPSSFGPQQFLWEGGLFIPPGTGQLLPGLSPGNDNALLSFQGANIQDSATNPNLLLTIPPSNKPILPLSNPANLHLRLNPRSGTYNGSFTLTDTHNGSTITRKVDFSGIFIPGKGGRGFFLLPQIPETSTHRSGRATLSTP